VEQKNHLQSADLRNLLLVSCLYLIFILFSFFYTICPLDDDWSYIRAAQTFYQTGQMQFTPWTSPSLVFQLWWGTLFAYFFGFSINTLIVSALVLSFIGMAFFYLLLREAEWNADTSLWLTVLFIFNPFSFPLLYTFFTDHYFIALMFISLFFYFRAVARGKLWNLLAGAVFASLAVLVRQQGILIAVGVSLFFLLNRKDNSRATISILASLSAPLITIIIYSYWFQYIHGPTYSSLQQSKWILEGITNPAHFFSKLFHRPFLILEFIGISLLPLSLSLLPSPSQLLQRRQSPLLLIFSLAGVLFYLTGDHAGMSSSIYSWMNGFHFAYVSEYGYRGAESTLLLFYKIIDFLSIFSITYLLFVVSRHRNVIHTIRASAPLVMLFVVGMLQIMYLFIIRFKFTRYYLILIPFVVLCAGEVFKTRSIQKKYFVPMLLGFVLLSFMGTQDFLSWNESRWRLGDRLLKNGIPVLKISGGFPWDCWHTMDYCLSHPYEIMPQSYDIPWWIEELTPAIDPEYLMANSPVPTGFYYLKYFYTDRYDVIDSADYISLLYFKKMKIYVLKRQPRQDAVHTGNEKTVYSFFNNFKGAEISFEDSGREGAVHADTITITNKIERSIIQSIQSAAVFRFTVPEGRCRLKMSLATLPATWTQPGDGITFKILLSDHLLENLYDEIGMVGVEQRSSFLKPRTYFFGGRTIYLYYIDPKKNPGQRKWHDVQLDLSRFRGKVVDLRLVVEPGPEKDKRFDTGIWGNPVIESY
jgi:hypothetical protein